MGRTVNQRQFLAQKLETLNDAEVCDVLDYISAMESTRRSRTVPPAPEDEAGREREKIAGLQRQVAELKSTYDALMAASGDQLQINRARNQPATQSRSDDMLDPPPRAGDSTTVPALLSEEEVRKLALDSKAGFTQDSKLRFDVNFNAASRMWHVLEYDPADPGGKAVVVSVDDQTRAVRVISG